MGMAQIIYVTEEACCLGFIVMLLISLVLKKEKSLTLHNLGLMYFSMGLWFASEMAVYLMDGQPQSIFIMQILDTVAYVSSLAYLLYFLWYFANLVYKKSGKTPAKREKFFATVALSLGILYYLSHRLGWFMSYSEDGHFIPGPFYPILQLPFLVVIVYELIFLWHYHNVFSRRQFVVLIFFVLQPGIWLFLPLVLPVSLLPLMVTLVGAFQFIYLNSEIEEELLVLDNQIKAQKAQLMMSQIQPHFLYNSLAAISTLCLLENAEKPRLAIEKFANYLRVNFDSLNGTMMVPFEKELEHVQTYLWLEQLRFGDDLRVAYDIQVSDFQVPSLIIQPLVENAVRHGICMKEDGGTVSISTKRTKDGVLILVEDNGAGFDPSERQDDGLVHVGLENTKMRIENICHGTMTIESIVGLGTKVTITIPERTDE